MDGSQVTYFTADYLAHTARDAARRSADPSEHWSPLVAVVFSALMVEAAVNEILHIVATSDEPLPDSVRRLKTLAAVTRLSERDASLGTKIQVIAAALLGQPLKEDRLPFQDFDLLIAARNFLVHYRPEHASRATDTAEWQLSNLVRRLTSRGFRSKNPGVEVPAAVELLRQSQVAIWAYETGTAMIREVLACFPNDYRVGHHLDPAFNWPPVRHP
jgi:hypothetical protein